MMTVSALMPPPPVSAIAIKKQLYLRFEVGLTLFRLFFMLSVIFSVTLHSLLRTINDQSVEIFFVAFRKTM